MPTVQEDLVQIARLVESQKLDDALAACREALSRRGDDPAFVHLMGRIHVRRGEPTAAREWFEKSTNLARRVDFLVEFFDVLILLRDAGAALALADRLFAALPRDAGRMTRLAQLLVETRQPARALALARRAIDAAPRHAEAYYAAAHALLQLGRDRQAIRPARVACELNPQSATYHWTLGNALMGANDYFDAAAAYLAAQKLLPNDPALLRNIALAKRECGLIDEAVTWLDRALAIRPDYVEAHVSLGTAYRRGGQFDKAIHHFDKALETDPDNAEALSGKSFILLSRKDHAGARELVLPRLRGHETDVNIALAFGRIAPGLDRHLDAARILTSFATRTDLPTVQRTAICFVIADLYDAIGHYEDAWYFCQMGNQLKGQKLDRVTQARFFANSAATFTRENLRAMPTSLRQSERPIFIVGMPRSGTTLVEQILASHPEVHGAGELQYVKRLVQRLRAQTRPQSDYPNNLLDISVHTLDEMATTYLKNLADELPPGRENVRFVTDKLPHNFLHIGLLSRVFPNARFVHCVRDPRDTCVSIYFQNFTGLHSYGYDLDNLGWYFRHYRQLMDHWKSVLPGRVFDVRYEDLVQQPEAHVRALLAHCDLTWNDRCMRFYETPRDVTTASYDQVVKPIYQTSVGRWKNYERRLGPLFRALESDGPTPGVSAR